MCVRVWKISGCAHDSHKLGTQGRSTKNGYEGAMCEHQFGFQMEASISQFFIKKELVSQRAFHNQKRPSRPVLLLINFPVSSH